MQTDSKVWACHAIQKGTPLSSGWWILQRVLGFPWVGFLMLATYFFLTVLLSQTLWKGALSFQRIWNFFLTKTCSFVPSSSPKTVWAGKCEQQFIFTEQDSPCSLKVPITSVFLQSSRQKSMIDSEWVSRLLPNSRRSCLLIPGMTGRWRSCFYTRQVWTCWICGEKRWLM